MKVFKFLNPLLLILMLSSSAILFQSCENACIHGSGSSVTQTRTLGSFSQISFSSEGTVYITQGPTVSFTVEAQQNVIDDLQTEIHGDELQIYNKHCLKDQSPIIIHVTTPNITAVSLSGTGEMITQGKIISDNFDFNVSGTGNIETQDTVYATNMSNNNSGTGTINLLAVCTSMNSTISGSGETTVAGVSNSQSVNISGSGNFHGFNFITDDASVTISGSGNAEVNVNNTLDVNISGSGNVYYKGFPAISVHISGSGGVINSN